MGLIGNVAERLVRGALRKGFLKVWVQILPIKFLILWKRKKIHFIFPLRNHGLAMWHLVPLTSFYLVGLTQRFLTWHLNFDNWYYWFSFPQTREERFSRNKSNPGLKCNLQLPKYLANDIIINYVIFSQAILAWSRAEWHSIIWSLDPPFFEIYGL